jgi:hypothetical protein
MGIFDAINKAASALVNTSLGAPVMTSLAAPIMLIQNTMFFHEVAAKIIAAHGLSALTPGDSQLEMPTVIYGEQVDLLKGVQDHSGVHTLDYAAPGLPPTQQTEGPRKSKWIGFGKGIAVGKSQEEANSEVSQAIDKANEAVARLSQLLGQQLGVSKLGDEAQSATATIVAARPAKTRIGEAELFDIDFAIGGDADNVVHYLEIVHPDLRTRVTVGAQVTVQFHPQAPAVVWAVW